MTKSLTQNPLSLILVVDDDPSIRLTTRHVLERDGHRVIEAEDGYQALTIFQQQRPDIVLLDALMPELNGFEACARLCQLPGADHIPILIITALHDAESVNLAFEAGAADYIVKPIHWAVLRRRVRYLLQANRAEAETQRRNRELTLLNQIIAASAASLEPEGILDVVCRELVPALNMAQATAGLFNETKTEIRIAAEYTTHNVPSVLNSLTSVASSPIEKFLLSHCAPLIVADVQSDPRLAQIRDLLRRRGAVSLLAVPLIVEGQVVGGLNLESNKPHHFSPEEVSLVWNVADQVAGVLARATLAQTRQHLIIAVEQVAESIIITDTTGLITYVNPAFEHTTGYSRSEVIGQTPRLLQYKSGNSDFYRELWTTINAGHVWHGRFVNKKKHGTPYTVDATITPVREENGAIVNFVGIQRDITSELQLEEQLRQSQKMEAIGRLAGGIAHDFNNLLTVINGYSELLLANHFDADDPHRQDIEQIKKAGERARGLTQQLLAFSRKQPLQPQTLNLNTIVDNIHPMLHRLISEDIRLTLTCEPGLGRVTADPGQIEQVILNLAINARDAMPQGGELVIQTANIILDEAYVRPYPQVTAGPYVLLAVSDTGIGMDQQTLTHIFELFFTTKENGKGTGLGLATVHSIVKQNGGHIWVESEPGQGTTFKVYLPQVPSLAQLPPAESDLTELSRGSETILVVEDEASVREITCNILEANGYKVLQAAGGPEALQLCADQRPEPIHLLFTDLVMPGMNGQELASHLAQQYPHLKVLYTSGYTPGYAESALVHYTPSENGLIYLEKPFSPNALLGKIREALNGETEGNQVGDKELTTV
jgi:PAS domain S-box-containing protein